MKIALLHYSVPPVVGGVESVLAHQARWMAAAGHRVCVVAARGADLAPEIPLRQAPRIDSRHADVLAVKQQLDAGQVTADFHALRTAIVEELAPLLADCDVVIAHNICSLAKNLALTAALNQLYTDPAFPHLVLWHHDLAWTTPRYRRELHAGYPWDLLRTDWPGATQVVISQLRRQELAGLLQIPAESIHVVPNGVDLERFYKLEAETADLAARLDLLAAAPLLLLPVRITRRKNIELAIRVMAALRDRMPAARLLVTGPLGAHNPANAAYFDELRRLRAALGLDAQVHFLAELSDAFLSDAVISDFYRLADALLLPSFEEGFGIPLIEAAISHLPVFCTDVAPLPELGAGDVTYFAPDADPGQVAAAVAARLEGSAVYRFAARARQQFTWRQVYALYIAPLLAPLDGAAAQEEVQHESTA